MIPQPRALPSPYSFPSTQSWNGNDGSWSTFFVWVGTPAQVFRVLVSTNGQETWVPVPAGCSDTDPSNCGALRGAEIFQGQPSTGFVKSESQTWNPQGTYELGLESNLNYTGVGDYGFDTVGLNLPGSNGPNLTHQIAAGIATKDFILGEFGLGPQPSNFTGYDNPQPSFLGSMKSQNLIPSLSYGYTAGASYRAKKILASLTLGGYDDSRFTPNSLSFSFASDDARWLTVGLQAIQITAPLISAINVDIGILSLIDSTIPEIWLPESICNTFEQSLGLTYDATTDRYIVNDSSRDQLLTVNPIFTFMLGNTKTGGDSINITLPYAAFDLQATWPIYPNATNYFPIRRAANDMQYTIGRTFLQEAYLIADYERNNFSISQCVFDDTPSNIQPLYPPGIITPVPTDSTPGPSSDAGGLSKGALIGIIVAVIVVVLIVLTGTFICLRIRKKKRQQRTETAALAAATSGLDEPKDFGIKEAFAPDDLPQEMLASERFPAEMELSPVRSELPSPQELPRAELA